MGAGNSSGPVADYGYGPTNGPHTWCLTAKHAAGGKQSPVNIVTDKCEEKLDFPELLMKPLESGLQEIKKGKHNFSITFPQEKKHCIFSRALGACVEGGPLRERYILQQFHFHWGHESKWGSEHHIDGFSHSAEMHLVFLAERYSDQKEALEDPEGLCVVGVFLRAGAKENVGFQPLVTAVEKAKTDSECVLDTPIDIFAILPNLSRYYTYEGSLTTPPCSECVRWIICADPVEISDTQDVADGGDEKEEYDEHMRYTSKSTSDELRETFDTRRLGPHLQQKDREHGRGEGPSNGVNDGSGNPILDSHKIVKDQIQSQGIVTRICSLYVLFLNTKTVNITTDEFYKVLEKHINVVMRICTPCFFSG
ncbi:unnamed protein product [Dibothriocephalus latus]|uniref:Carbonic anhydrase n=1 Tax=Dibothriocephalus latus TaxID=60516 RepID=A0A3P6TW47_DIBLA|nr:unnamed protein product [Dibothriocephalus latus]